MDSVKPRRMDLLDLFLKVNKEKDKRKEKHFSLFVAAICYVFLPFRKSLRPPQNTPRTSKYKKKPKRHLKYFFWQILAASFASVKGSKLRPLLPGGLASHRRPQQPRYCS